MSTHKIWINGTWYISVNDDGECISPCYEGVFGIVIKLCNAYDQTKVSALKVPRLMGETYRENAYINDLLEKELLVVGEIFDGPGKRDCLIDGDTQCYTKSLS
jgi:hypothetical protein